MPRGETPQPSFCFQLPECRGPCTHVSGEKFRGLRSREPDWAKKKAQRDWHLWIPRKSDNSTWKPVVSGFCPHMHSFHTAFQCFTLKCEHAASLLHVNRAKDYQMFEGTPEQVNLKEKWGNKGMWASKTLQSDSVRKKVLYPCNSNRKLCKVIPWKRRYYIHATTGN